MSYPTGTLSFSVNPGTLTGYTVYRKVSTRSEKQFVPTGEWETIKIDIGDWRGPHRETSQKFEERDVLVTIESWIAIPNAQVAAYEASFGK